MTASQPRRGSSPRGAATSVAAATSAPLLLVSLLFIFATERVSAASCYRSLSRADFPHCKLLSPQFALHWAVRDENITLGLDADTGGYPNSWLAIGLSDAGGMKGADIIIVAGPAADAVDNAEDGGAPATSAAAAAAAAKQGAAGPGGWRVIDAHSLDFRAPMVDVRQDVALRGAPLSGANHTVAVVTRRLRTCDPWDRNIQVGIPQTVSWAMGRDWPSQHLARGDSSAFFVPEADQLWGLANSTTANGTATATATPTANPTTASTTAATSQRRSFANLFSATAASTLPAKAPSDTAKAPIVTKSDSGAENDPRVTSAPLNNAVAVSNGDNDGGIDGDNARLTASVPLPADAELRTLDVLMPNVTVPANRTTSYMCTHVVMPRDRKYHIVASRAQVRSPLIHHMILFACEKPPAQPRPGEVFDCLSTGGGPGCNTFYIGWAPGQMGGSYPPSVGLPIGESDSTYFSLQVHYNNPEGQEGLVDTSGFKLYYTPKLRPYDAAVLTVGQQAIVIPPGKKNHTLQPNVCPAACTSRLAAPLRLLASGLHMHTLGRSIVTQHIRNGSELPPVGSKRFYDFNFQSSDPVPLDSSILAPGDTLITTCTFDSTSRTNITKFGESTKDEMCFNFILYYPKNPNFTACTSMDAAGDPRVALCGGWDSADKLEATLKQLKQQQAAQNSSASAAPVAGASQAVTSPSVDLGAVPALAPLFASGELVRVAPSDTEYEPYGRQCPDMSYAPA